jgi:hypothetical protein
VVAEIGLRGFEQIVVANGIELFYIIPISLTEKRQKDRLSKKLIR